MTEIEQQFNQATQDAITLDYSKWSFQQRQAKSSTDHSLWQTERDKVLQRQQYDNALAHDRHRASLEAEKAVRRAENEAELDKQLEPQKQTLMREWLANNPGKSENDFNNLAWAYLRQNLIEQRKSEAMNAEIQRLSASSRYSL